MKIQIEDVLTKTCDIEKFEDIEGWDNKLMKATVHYVHELHGSNIKKITTRILNAWDEIEPNERVILEEHFGRKNIVMVGLAIGVFEAMKSESMKKMFGGIIEKIIRIEEEKDDDKE